MSSFDTVFFDELRLKLAKEAINQGKLLESYIESLPDKVESRQMRERAQEKLQECIYWVLIALKIDQKVDQNFPPEE